MLGASLSVPLQLSLPFSPSAHSPPVDRPRIMKHGPRLGRIRSLTCFGVIAYIHQICLLTRQSIYPVFLSKPILGVGPDWSAHDRKGDAQIPNTGVRAQPAELNRPRACPVAAFIKGLRTTRRDITETSSATELLNDADPETVFISARSVGFTARTARLFVRTHASTPRAVASDAETDEEICDASALLVISQLEGVSDANEGPTCQLARPNGGRAACIQTCIGR